MQVIYDTLIEQSEPMEVVAVLAHELGHWANWDTTRQLLISEVQISRVTNLRSISLPSFLCFQRSSTTGVCISHSGLQINPP
jgi:STE24 endopeptidase